MPIPTPRAGESQSEFIGRCMSDDTMVQEFPDEDQRTAVCESQYASSKGEGLVAPITWKDEAKRLVYGPVLVPDQPDSDGDKVSAEKIEQVAHKFLEDYGLLEDMHTLVSVAKPVESYIAPTDITLDDRTAGRIRVPKGSWIMGARVSEDAWPDVVSGKRTGFSIVAVPKEVKKRQTADKRTTLRQIEESGQDWEVVAVGLVDKPAVPMAKWTAVKSADESFTDKFKRALGIGGDDTTTAQKAGRTISEANLRKLRNAGDGLSGLSEVINDLISIAETERGSQKNTQGGDSMAGEEITEEKLQELLDTAIDKALDKRGIKKHEENEEEEEDSKNKEKETTSTSTSTETETSGLTEDQLDAALEKAVEKGAAKATADILTKFEEHIESTPKVSAKSLQEALTGQDGHGSTKGAKETRDPWGRKKKKADA